MNKLRVFLIHIAMMVRSANFSVPGAGKTSIVYGAYAYLLAKGLVNKIVMIGPINSFMAWKNEFVANFGDKQENYNRFQQLKYECLTFEKKAADMEIHGKDGTILKLVVNVDKQTGQYACTLRVDGNMLIKMKALSFEAKRQ